VYHQISYQIGDKLNSALQNYKTDPTIILLTILVAASIATNIVTTYFLWRELKKKKESEIKQYKPS